MNIYRNLPHADHVEPMGTDHLGPANDEDDIVEIGEILQAVRRHWIGVLVILILGLAAAFLLDQFVNAAIHGNRNSPDRPTRDTHD